MCSQSYTITKTTLSSQKLYYTRFFITIPIRNQEPSSSIREMLKETQKEERKYIYIHKNFSLKIFPKKRENAVQKYVMRGTNKSEQYCNISESKKRIERERENKLIITRHVATIMSSPYFLSPTRHFPNMPLFNLFFIFIFSQENCWIASQVMFLFLIQIFVPFY